MMILALLEDHLALVVQHVVEFQDVLADLEVARFDLLLRLFQGLVDPGMGDRFALLQAEARQHRIHALRSEDAHQIVLQAEEELGGAGVALAARAAAQLVVDAPAFVALGADDVEPARGDHLFLVGGDFGADLGRASASSSWSRTPPSSVLMRMSALPPSWMSVPRPAMLVAMVTVPETPGLRDDRRFLLVIARVQHVVLDLALLQQIRKLLGLLDRGGADQHRLAALLAFFDQLDDRLRSSRRRCDRPRRRHPMRFTGMLVGMSMTSSL